MTKPYFYFIEYFQHGEYYERSGIVDISITEPVCEEAWPRILHLIREAAGLGDATSILVRHFYRA